MNEIRVFISYCHENDIWLQEWLDEKQTKKNPRYLLNLWELTFRKQQVVFWHDRDEEAGLRGGDRWRARILEEIDRADVAVLLVTQDFIVSPFIRDEELPRILERSKQGKTEILPILLEPARWKDLEIHGMFQLTPGKPTPLSQFESSDHEWKTARNEVLEALERTITRVREKRNPSGPTPPVRNVSPIPTSIGNEAGYKLPATLEELERRLSVGHPKNGTGPEHSIAPGMPAPNTLTNKKGGTQPPWPLELGASARIATVAGLSGTLEALQGVVPSTTEVPHTFDPLLQVPASAELLQLTRQLYDDVSFRRLSPGERGIFNARMLTIIRSMGGALREVVETIPEADYLMALVFMVDMERISKMGSILEQVERDAVLYAFPGKIEEYLTKYLTRAPNGRFAKKAKELLNAIVSPEKTPVAQGSNLRDISIPEREALIRDIPILAKRTLSSSSYTCTFRLDPDQEGIFVRVEIFFQNQPATNGTQTFRLPGSHTFSASEDFVSIMIASKGLINLGRYDRATASALAHALSRLNALLSEEKADEA